MNILIFAILLLGFGTNVWCQYYQTNPVQTNSGAIVGLYLTTVQKQIPYFSFRGIPYAVAQKFKPAQRVGWNDILYATEDKDMCLQPNDKKEVVGSEDCLYLNVYSPNTNYFGSNNKNGLKPVIVWIHGGSFTTGNGNSSYYGPDFLLEAEVVVVTIQYRLGPLGFLNILGTGNLGLKDQVLALRWVKENIVAFGGDPNRITLMGQSAGGVAVDLHKLSPMSAGLFQQTISMSASPLCKYWSFQSKAEASAQAYVLGAKFGFKAKSDIELFDFLSNNVTSIEIIKKASELPGIPFRPTLENSPDAFLSECTPKTYHEGNYHKGPHLMGFTSNEILSMSKSFDDLIRWHKNAAQSVQHMDFLKILPHLPELLTVKFETIASLKKTAFSFLIEQLSDVYFTTGIDMKQRLLAKHNQAPVYYYRYDFKAPTHESAHKSEGVIILDGVSHEDELPYLWFRPFLNITLNNPEITLTRERLVRMWTNFARYGNPTPFGANDQLLQGVTWPDSGEAGTHMEITDNLKIGPRPTNALVTLYQKFGFGDSSIYNDCTRTTLSNIINGLANIPATAEEIINGSKGYFDKFKNTVVGATNKLSDIVSNAKGGIDSFVSDAIEAKKSLLKGAAGAVVNAIEDIKDAAKDVLHQIVGK